MKNDITELKKNILNNIKATVKEDYQNIYDFFLDKKQNHESDRLSIYKEYMTKYKFESLPEAKYQILKIQLSDKIYDLTNQALDFSLVDIAISAELISEIKNLKKIFKNHDKINFKEFIADSIKDMNSNELNSIFNNHDIAYNDVETIVGKLEEALNNKIAKINDPLNFAMNHPLISLLSIPREKKSFPETAYEKYKNLAEKLKEYYVDEYSERFTGAITYLIHLDYTYGLNKLGNVKDNESIKIVNTILKKIDDETFTKKDMDKLMNLALIESENFISVGKGTSNDINSTPNTKNTAGVMDRRFGTMHIHDAGSKGQGQNKQIVRGAELALKHKNYFPTIMQVSTDTAVAKDEVYFNSELSEKELFIINYSKNVSGLLSFLSNENKNKKKNVSNSLDITTIDLMANISEIYTDKMDNSIAFFNSLNLISGTEKKIKTFVDSLLYIHNEKLNTDKISNDESYRLNEFVLLPLITTIKAIKGIKDVYPTLGQSFNYGINILKKHTENLNYYSTIADKVESLLDEPSYEANFDAPEFLNKPFKQQDRFETKTVSEIIQYLEDNKETFKLTSLKASEKEFLGNLAEARTASEYMPQLLALYKEIATKNILDLKDRKKGKKLSSKKIAEIVNPFTHENKEGRILFASTTTHRLNYLLNKELDSKTYNELDIIYTLKEITKGEIKLSKNELDNKFKDKRSLKA